MLQCINVTEPPLFVDISLDSRNLDSNVLKSNESVITTHEC